MKQKMIICVWTIAGIMFLACCNRSTVNNASMKMPLESREGQGSKPATILTDTIGMIITGKKISKSISPYN